MLKKLGILGLVIAIYIGGFFGNFKKTGLYPGWVSGRVSDFFDKPRIRFGFFFFF